MPPDSTITYNKCVFLPGGGGESWCQKSDLTNFLAISDHFCYKMYGKQEKKETLKVFNLNFCRLKSEHTRKGGSAAFEPSRESPGWSFL